MSDELLLRALKTIGIPDVVLVAEGDQVAFTESNGMFEISGGTQGHSVLYDFDGEGDRSGERANDGKGLICRPVIADHQFVGQPGLCFNAGQLFREKPLAFR